MTRHDDVFTSKGRLVVVRPYLSGEREYSSGWRFSEEGSISFARKLFKGEVGIILSDHEISTKSFTVEYELAGLYDAVLFGNELLLVAAQDIDPLH